jgi:hypothetical protein
MLIAADFDACRHQTDTIIRMLGKPFAHRGCFQFHADTNVRE